LAVFEEYSSIVADASEEQATHRWRDGGRSGHVINHAAHASDATDFDAARARLSERIEKARRMFVSRAHAKIDRAAELISVLERDGATAGSPELGELRTIAHSISGTAGSFGYDRLSEIAEKLEAAISSGRHLVLAIADLVVAMAIEFLHNVAGLQLQVVR